MKKILALVLVALTVVAMAVPATAANSFTAAKGTAVVDGKMDDAYKAAPEIAINVKVSGDGKTSGTARVLWDDKNIYVLFNITDPVVSEKFSSKNCYDTDSVEFMLNLEGKDGKLEDVNAGQYTAPGPLTGATTEWNGRGKHWDANKANAKFASSKTDKGYIVEMSIPWGDGFTAKADAKIGVCFHINSDEDGKEGREGEYFAGKDQGNA